MRLAGMVLIAVGVLALIYQGFTYTKRRDTVRLGPVEVAAEQKERVALPPIIGVVAIVAGAGLLLASRRKA
jgi:hypothetical protein